MSNNQRVWYNIKLMDELWWITISIIIHRWNHDVSYIRLMMWLSLAMSWLLSSYVNLPGMGHGNAFETWSSRANSCFKTLFCIWLTFKFVWIYIYIIGKNMLSYIIIHIYIYYNWIYHDGGWCFMVSWMSQASREMRFVV